MGSAATVLNLLRKSAATVLNLYVIYRHPRGFPGKYVVRQHAATKDGVAVAVEPLAVVDSLPAARRALPPGLYNMGRMADDDPRIVEVWI